MIESENNRKDTENNMKFSNGECSDKINNKPVFKCSDQKEVEKFSCFHKSENLVYKHLMILRKKINLKKITTSKY